MTRNRALVLVLVLLCIAWPALGHLLLTLVSAAALVAHQHPAVAVTVAALAVLLRAVTVPSVRFPAGGGQR